MRKNLIVTVLLFFVFTQISSNETSFNRLEDLNDFFALKWKRFIGGTSYRTNISYCNSNIIVGSNGMHYADYSVTDKNNGVYFLNAKTGAILKHIEKEGFGDEDVNGVGIQNGRVFFGNDNDEIFCYSTAGKLLWSMPASGDIESAPALININNDNIKDPVFATETGEIAAYNGVNGKKLWSFKQEGFNGWEQTQNRFVFRIAAHFKNGSGFMCKPLAFDIDNDDVLDVLVTSKDGIVYAIDGSNGEELWKYNTFFFGTTQSPVSIKYKGKNYFGITSGKSILLLDKAGKKQYEFAFSHWISDALPVMLPENKLIVCHENGISVLNFETGDIKYSSIEGKITATPIVEDALDKVGSQVIVPMESGKLAFLGIDGSIQKVFSFSKGSECSPLFVDVDGDSKKELLISSYDGYLYCYQIKR